MRAEEQAGGEDPAFWMEPTRKQGTLSSLHQENDTVHINKEEKAFFTQQV